MLSKGTLNLTLRLIQRERDRPACHITQGVFIIHFLENCHLSAGLGVNIAFVVPWRINWLCWPKQPTLNIRLLLSLHWLHKYSWISFHHIPFRSFLVHRGGGRGGRGKETTSPVEDVTDTPRACVYKIVTRLPAIATVHMFPLEGPITCNTLIFDKCRVGLKTTIYHGLERSIRAVTAKLLATASHMNPPREKDSKSTSPLVFRVWIHRELLIIFIEHHYLRWGEVRGGSGEGLVSLDGDGRK